MNLGQLKTAVAARGFNYLLDGSTDEDRLERVINQSYQQICEMERWPFLNTAFYTGALPSTIADLGRIEAVTFNASTSDQQLLEPKSREWLLRSFPSLTQTGTPLFYYLNDTSLRVFPVNTGQFTVVYWEIPPDLSADSDTPLIPSRWHSVIEDLAVFYLAEDQETRQNANANVERQLLVMRQSLLAREDIAYQQITGAAEDW
jgi:hypothetical protein